MGTVVPQTVVVVAVAICNHDNATIAQKLGWK
jgi:hypothetical protein